MLRRTIFPAVALIVLLLSARSADVAYGVQPINFLRGTVAGSGFLTSAPTAVEMGPDGRLYVADGDGKVQALTLDPNTKQVTAVQLVASGASLQEVYGIAFDPTDSSSPPTVYVTNTLAGLPPDATDPSTFPGKVTRISGPGYSTITDIITGLPISKSAHEANDLAFGPDGRLYIEQGSSTNAGIVNPAPDPNFPLFLYPDTPISGAILVADIKAPGFNGTVTYSPQVATNPNIVQTGGDVSVYAPGFRNPYGMVWHSNGFLYATDNGPNAGYGGPSTTCTNPSAGDAAGLDELDLVEAGKYYGHANRNRGAAGDARQCVFHYGVEPSTADYTAPIEANLPASSDGMVEYKSSNFGGQMQGDLLYAAWVDSQLHRVKLSADGRSVISDTTLATGLQNALSVAAGTDGTIYVAEYGANKITFLKPDESAVNSITVTGISPNAGPIDGGQAVTITGTNFTTAADTTVKTIGGQPLTNVVVQSSTTMTATTPPNTAGLKDLTITNSIGTATLANAYNYVTGGGTVPPVANAGPDISSPVSHENHGHVTLDGSASFDPDGFIANYSWTEGATVLASGTANKVVAELTQGVHSITLTVTDNDNLTSSDAVRVTITSGPQNPSQFFCPDVNGDTRVDSTDQLIQAGAFNKRFGQVGYARMKDANVDRNINSTDMLIVASRFTHGTPCSIEDQMARASTVAIEKYQNVNAAIADGYVQVTQFISQQGRHMVKSSLEDTTFDPAVPEGLLYEPDSSTPGGWRLGGAFYIMPITLNPLVPDGFPGTDDAWHYHDFLCFYPNGTVTVDNQATCTSRGGSYQTNVGWLLHLWNYVLPPYGPGRYVENNVNFVGLP
ncbi:MAG: PQQ-dependent sugar dehydrogenase [Chloroflexota bacterium]|nr:PQQ-dependent sugar dehydrogenase [Chloroflexota bacterium]